MERKEFLLNIIREIGEFQKKHFGTEIRFQEKSGPTDMISFVDIQSQQMFENGVQENFPNDKILGEETYDPAAEIDADSLWIIDPLDGTVVFKHKMPLFGISIAYMQDGKVVLGAIYMPILDELYWADETGAYCESQPIQVSKQDRLDKALFFASTKLLVNKIGSKGYTRIVEETGKTIYIPCTVWAQVLVASGQTEGMCFLRHKSGPWDVAAGGFIIQKAGGKVTGLRGGEWSPLRIDTIASNGVLHDEFVRLLNE